MRNIIIGVVLVILSIGLFGGLYKVDQRSQAIVLEFSKVVRTVQEPGLKLKIPLIQDVVLYDKRILDLDPRPFEVLVTDQKRILVDAFARYRIVDPALFFIRVQTYNGLQDRFGKNLNASMQRILAEVSLTELLSDKRRDIMQRIATDLRPQAESFGIELLEVRIGRTDLPPTTREAVYQRMQAERNKEAFDLRARGEEAGRRIRAQADKEATIIRSEAQRSADVLRGEGEGSRNRILGEAYGRSPEFFSFYKSLEEYANALMDKGTTWVLSPDSEFFQYLKSPYGK